MQDPKSDRIRTMRGTDPENNLIGKPDKSTKLTDRQSKKILNETLVKAFHIKHPNWPVTYIPKKYKLNTSNGVTQSIIAYIKAKGFQAERITTTGRMIDRSKIVSDVLGHRRKIGGLEYIPGTGTKGSSDISCTIKNEQGIGVSVKIEVKIGRDKQSQAQKDYQLSIEKLGCYYYVARDFASFLEWFTQKFGRADND